MTTLAQFRGDIIRPYINLSLIGARNPRTWHIVSRSGVGHGTPDFDALSERSNYKKESQSTVAGPPSCASVALRRRLSIPTLGARRCCEVESTSLTLIQRRNNGWRENAGPVSQKWNESGFRLPLCTYNLNWARRTSWGWWDDLDDTVLQTMDSKFEPWRSESEHATSRSRRLPTILTFTRGWGRNRRDREPNPELWRERQRC